MNHTLADLVAEGVSGWVAMVPLRTVNRLMCAILLPAALTLSACTGGGSNAMATASTSMAAQASADEIRPGAALDGMQIVSALPEPDGTVSDAIQPNDVLEVIVFQVDDLNRTVSVDDRGMIALPLVGTLPAAGQTPRQLEATLRGAYGSNYLQNPEISVLVKESPNQVVTMEGEFRKPGAVPVTTQSSLLRAIAASGGLTEIADENKLFVSRRIGERTLVASYSIGKIRNGTAADPRVFGGDVVIAFASGSRVAMRNLREVLGLATSASGLATGL
jgi:polysaccharide biosynthesis/export protein